MRYFRQYDPPESSKSQRILTHIRRKIYTDILSWIWIHTRYFLPVLCISAIVAGIVLIGSSRPPTIVPMINGSFLSDLVFLDGFYGLERHPSGWSYRWTSGNALIQLRGAFFAAPAYRADIRLRAEHPVKPQPITWLVGGHHVATTIPEERFRVYHLLIGTESERGELWLALNTPTFTPSDNPRPLGVVITDVVFHPLSRPDLLRAVIVVTGLLVLWISLRIARLHQRDATALTVLASIGVATLTILYRPAALPFETLVVLLLTGVLMTGLIAYELSARLGLATITIICSLAGVIWPSWLADDAFISFRYAQNLVQGHGLVYNIGERVEGYTNFLWTIIAAGVLSIGGDIVLWCHTIGVILAITIVVGTYRLASVLIGSSWALVSALIVGTSQSVLLYTARGSGMETGLFSMLLLSGCGVFLTGERLDRRGFWLLGAGFIFGLTALTRPEGLFVFAITVGYVFLKSLARASKERFLHREILMLIAPFLTLVVPFFLWRLSYYGDFLPNTFYAKTGGSLSQIHRGLIYASEFAITIGGPLLLVIAVPWIWNWRAALRSWRSYIFLLTLSYTVYIIAVGGDHFRGERFFVPLIPWFAILTTDGIAFLHSRLHTAQRFVSLLLFVVLIAGGMMALMRTTPLDKTIRGLDESIWIWREIGWWIADHTSQDASIAAAGAGAIAFYSQRTVIDMFGLTDPHIGRLSVPNMGQGVAGHEKRDPEYILFQRRPTYIPRIWDDYFGGEAALTSNYRLITVTSRTGRALQLWERVR